MSADEKENISTFALPGVLEIKSFEVAFNNESIDEDYTKRRFMNLFMSSASTRAYGANGFVTKASNAFGETFAVKQMRLDPDAGQTPNAFQSRPSENALRAFRAEYESQRYVSSLKGFPRLHIWGTTASGNPLIVMDWIEGVNLSDFLRSKAFDGHLSWDIVAALGLRLFDTLSNMQMLESEPVHRDLSPRNLIIRTSETSLDKQVASGDFDLYIIDFGSMTVADTYDPRLTSTTSIFRRATPEYAPPEMLADSLDNIIDLRQSPSIDVYAACSVLYELASGRTPFSLYLREGVSPYEVKTTETPDYLDTDGEGQAVMALAQGIMQGLSPAQNDRPKAQELRELCRTACGKNQPAPNANAQLFSPQYPGRVLFARTPENGGASVVDASFHRQAQTSGKTLSRRAFIGIAAGGIAALALGGIGTATFLGVTNRQDSAQNTSSNNSSKTLPSMSQEDITAGNKLFPVKDISTGLWGYMNKQGTWAIEPAFINAGLFSEGVACITEDNATMRFINARGEYAIEKSLDIATNNVHTVAFHDSLASVAGSTSQSAGVNYFYGAINMNGDWVINPTYSSIGNFNQGLAAFRYDSNSKVGYLDTSGQIAIASQFYSAGPFTDDKLAVAAASKTQYGWIYTTGGWLGITEPTYAYAGKFSEGFACFVRNDETGLYGFVNTNGEEIITPMFKSAHCFGDGKCPAQDTNTGLWGLIDTNANWTLSPQYADMGWFHNGLVAVKDADTGLYGYITSDGEVAIPLQYATDESTGLV